MNPWATSFDISGPSGPWVCSFNIGGFTSGLGGGGVFLPTFSAIAPIGAAGDILYNAGGTWEALELDSAAFEIVDGKLTAPAVTSSGTVTAVTVATANGISAAVADQGTTPILTLTLGAITPTSVNGLTLAAQSVGFTIAGGTTPETLTVAGTASISGTNTGDQTWSTLTGKPSFAAVATSGAYADLSGTPSPYFSVGLGTSTLGSSGISLDGMSGLSAVGFIKRTAANTWGIGALSTVAVSGAYADLSGKPSLAAVATSGSYADLSSKPTIDTLLPSETGDSGKFLTTNGTSASWAALSVSPGGSANQVQFNSSGAFAGTSGLTFDGVHTVGIGDGTGAILKLGGTYSPTGFNTPVASIVLPPNTNGRPSYIAVLDTTSNNTLPILIGGGYNQYNNPSWNCISFNNVMDYTATGLQYFATAATDNYYSLWITNNSAGGLIFATGALAPQAALVGQNFLFGLRNTNSIVDNQNGTIQVCASTNPAQGIAFGNDSIQTTIYRYGQSVLAIGPCNILLGSLTGTTATDGWPYLPSTAGAPTGTPNNIVAGYSQVQIDPANGKLWAYYGGSWHYALFV